MAWYLFRQKQIYIYFNSASKHILSSPTTNLTSAVIRPAYAVAVLYW